MANKKIVRTISINISIDPDKDDLAMMNVQHPKLTVLETIAYLEHAKIIIINGSRNMKTISPSKN